MNKLREISDRYSLLSPMVSDRVFQDDCLFIVHDILARNFKEYEYNIYHENNPASGFVIAIKVTYHEIVHEHLIRTSEYFVANRDSFGRITLIESIYKLQDITNNLVDRIKRI
jgi:hypothetical protein